MLKYIERKQTDSTKWDGLESMFGEKDLLPLWVADMDFQICDCVIKKLKEYLEFGVLGYYKEPEGYKQSFINWEKTYHNYEISKEYIRYSPGVVPAINWLIQILTEKNDSVIVLTPVYYPFLDAVKNNDRKLIESDLVNEHGRYTINFKDFENKIVENNVKLFILCSPHNPVGRVWKKDELQSLVNICKKHNVKVISDEIHQDIIIGKNDHIPTASISEYDSIITLTAGTKTFNLAACKNSFVIISNPEILKAFDNFVQCIRIPSGNTFGYIAVQSAYENGREWLEEILNQIRENYLYIKETFNKELPLVEISPLEGTYLLWINLGSYINGEDTERFIKEKCKLALDFGEWFGGERFNNYVRMNIATSKENIAKAVNQIVHEIQIMKNK
ncbi:MalY/PatB family protein [Clostridium scatologenes]|uniref:cysteine-S-conjugate beta-lyase n=1 Tax=Clostridium scatologenes TaxID=1548 RepID=A0A0E3GRB6_CLOSL|nr:MalY/PatB family protein [Clostridium scatologenes]AKA70036.1 aminotransferase class I and II [Clostridium scatologenes]